MAYGFKLIESNGASQRMCFACMNCGRWRWYSIEDPKVTQVTCTACNTFASLDGIKKQIAAGIAEDQKKFEERYLRPNIQEQKGAE